MRTFSSKAFGLTISIVAALIVAYVGSYYEIVGWTSATAHSKLLRLKSDLRFVCGGYPDGYGVRLDDDFKWEDYRLVDTGRFRSPAYPEWCSQFCENIFDPIHSVDRRLRPDLWKIRRIVHK